MNNFKLLIAVSILQAKNKASGMPRLAVPSPTQQSISLANRASTWCERGRDAP
jgi:hypothetical protein